MRAKRCRCEDCVSARKVLGKDGGKEYDGFCAEGTEVIVQWIEDGEDHTGWVVYPTPPDGQRLGDEFWLGQWTAKSEAMAFVKNHGLKSTVIPKPKKGKK